MTRIKTTATLAAAVAATFLLSTSLASAREAPHRDPAQSAAHYREHGSAHATFRSGNKTRDARGRQDREARDRHDGRSGRAFADRDHRVRYSSYDYAHYRDRFHRPPLRFEVVGHAPRAGLRWHGGYWEWQGGQWVWFAGFWRIAFVTHR